MTDSGASSLDYKEINSCKLFTFPLTESKNAIYQLHALKHGEIYLLLDSTEKLPSKEPNSSIKSCLAFDSYFKVLRANSAVFKVDYDDDAFVDDSDEAAFDKAFEKKDYINTLIITSDSNSRSTMFTIIKDRDELC